MKHKHLHVTIYYYYVYTTDLLSMYSFFLVFFIAYQYLCQGYEYRGEEKAQCTV